MPAILPPFAPTRVPDGASPVGHSYLNDWAICRRRWFNRYLRPMPDGAGIEPLVVPYYFLTGQIFHEWMAAWLLSGSKGGKDSGEYDGEAALSAAKACWTRVRPQYESDTIAEAEWTLLEHIGREYHDWYGPGGLAPQFPDIELVHDSDGQPIVEREYALPLGVGNYYYTTRVDAVIRHLGYLKIYEHKTAAATRVGTVLASAALDAQFTGEAAILDALYPNDRLHGVLLNVVVKGRSGKSKLPVASTRTTTRSPLELSTWRVGVERLLREITEEVERWRQAGNVDKDPALSLFFPQDGTHTNQCQGCDFAELCRMGGDEGQALLSYRTRAKGTAARSGKGNPW